MQCPDDDGQWHAPARELIQHPVLARSEFLSGGWPCPHRTPGPRGSTTSHTSILPMRRPWSRVATPRPRKPGIVSPTGTQATRCLPRGLLPYCARMRVHSSMQNSNAYACFGPFRILTYLVINCMGGLIAIAVRSELANRKIVPRDDSQRFGCGSCFAGAPPSRARFRQVAAMFPLHRPDGARRQYLV